jgi:hypothetical protein
MKLFGNIYTDIKLEVLIPQIILPNWKVNKKSDNEFLLTADKLNITVEGQQEILVFGELDIAINVVDEWVELISALPVHFNIDLHGDEARLMRRYLH